MGSMLGLLLAAYFVKNPLEAYYISPAMAVIFFVAGIITGIFVDGGDEVFASFLTTSIIMLGSLLAAFKPGITTPPYIVSDIRLMMISFLIPFLITAFGSVFGNYVSYLVEGGGNK